MSDETAAAEVTAIDPLTFEQARVLGCLVEKEMTTPEYYPLTLNALVAACNQSSNRDPVVDFHEQVVQEAVEVLKVRGFAFQVTIPGARVQKYKHNLNGKFPRLEKQGLALMCVLLLRGAQTAGELRQRTERLHAFSDIPSLEYALQELITYPEMPLVTAIPAGAGRKAVTYAQLLCGPVEVGQAQVTSVASISRGSSSVVVDAEWKERIESELQALREEVAQMRRLLEGEETADGEGTGDSGTFVP